MRPAAGYRSGRRRGWPRCHAGFYQPARHVRECVELLGARRIGHGVTAYSDPDEQLAAMARHSIEASAAPAEVRRRLLAGLASWLTS